MIMVVNTLFYRQVWYISTYVTNMY